MELTPNKTLLKIAVLPTANAHYTTPNTIGEVYKYIGELTEADHPNQPDSFRKQFIQVLRLKDKVQYTLSRSYFKQVKGK